MKPEFEVPTDVVTFADRDAFIAFLDQQRIPYQKWRQPNPELDEPGTLEKVWNEVLNRDTLVTTAQTFGIPFNAAVIRHIRTATAWITHASGPGDRQIEVLQEFKVRKGVMVPRKYAGSSLSEKLTWDLAGGNHELPLSGLKRAFWEELGLVVDDADLASDRISRMIIPRNTTVVRGSRILSENLSFLCPIREAEAEKRNIDLDIHWMDTGIVTHNQVVHYSWAMPDRYYQGKYVNGAANYVSEWRSVHHSSLTGTE